MSCDSPKGVALTGCGLHGGLLYTHSTLAYSLGTQTGCSGNTPNDICWYNGVGTSEVVIFSHYNMQCVQAMC